jgi:hypothetical protein
MKKVLFVSALVVLLGSTYGVRSQTQPKRLLLVTTSLGFRHAGVTVQERMIREMARTSGDFTVVSTTDSPNYPTAEYAAAIERLSSRIPREGAPDNRLSEAQIRERAAAAAAGGGEARGGGARAGGGGRAGGGRGGARGAAAPPAPGVLTVADKVALVLREYLSPDALKNYDAVAFLSTTGQLPIPDAAAFYKWVSDGHGFIGLHSATDTLRQSPEYIAMIGGEFAGHGPHTEVAVKNLDPASPLTTGWPDGVRITEEWYNFSNYDRSKVHVLLGMETHASNGTPGHFPVSWIKPHGSGRVFYSSMGHRDDVIDPGADIGDQEYKVRYNPPGTAVAVRAHLLTGIRWALGLVAAEARVGTR